MKQIKVTRGWAANRHPCPNAKREFFKRWPNGLTLTRRNLYMVAKECPIWWLDWFAYEILKTNRRATYGRLSKMTDGPNGHPITSPAKKRAYVKALADALKL